MEQRLTTPERQALSLLSEPETKEEEEKAVSSLTRGNSLVNLQRLSSSAAGWCADDPVASETKAESGFMLEGDEDPFQDAVETGPRSYGEGLRWRYAVGRSGKEVEDVILSSSLLPFAQPPRPRSHSAPFLTGVVIEAPPPGSGDQKKSTGASHPLSLNRSRPCGAKASVELQQRRPSRLSDFEDGPSVPLLQGSDEDQEEREGFKAEQGGREGGGEDGSGGDLQRLFSQTAQSTVAPDARNVKLNCATFRLFWRLFRIGELTTETASRVASSVLPRILLACILHPYFYLLFTFRIFLCFVAPFFVSMFLLSSVSFSFS